MEKKESILKWFELRDWVCAGVSFIISFGVYLYTLMPTVGLEDSGELVTGAYSVGVVHPPGYPVWTILAKLFTFLPVGDIAYRVNLMSAFFAALSVGILGLIISKSAVLLFTGNGKTAEKRYQNFTVPVGAISGSLIFAFTPVLWSQSVITEVYTLNVFFLVTGLLLCLIWIYHPSRRGIIYLNAFLFGLGLTNHQTLFVMAAAYLFLLLMVDKSIFKSPKAIAAILGSFLAGLACYLYMPLASMTNPPLNWGYPRTFAGFMRSLRRSQYPEVAIIRPLRILWGQINIYFDVLAKQFTLPLALTACFTLFFARETEKSQKLWLRFIFLCFILLSVALVILINPKFDIHSQYVNRIHFVLSHCIFSLWIGYGLIFLGNTVVKQVTNHKSQVTSYTTGIILMVILALPAVPLVKNWKECNLRGHNFGYRFGHDALVNMDKDAILFGGTDPGRFVPLYMINCARFRPDVRLITQNALADHTYLSTLRDRYCEPVLVWSWVKRLLGFFGVSRSEPKGTIYILDKMDMDLAFKGYFEEAKRKAAAGQRIGAKVRVTKGKISVRGVGGVMQINGILAKRIFEKNKDKHSFYCEESYVIPWMYDYLVPRGLLMQIMPEKVKEITGEEVEKDGKYWKAYEEEFLNDPRFLNDLPARKTFAKCRSAIAGVYAYRKMFKESEEAFKQARRLCPSLNEVYIRLSELYVAQDMYAQAITNANKFLKIDPYNRKMHKFIHSLKQRKQLALDIKRFKSEIRREGETPEKLFRLALLHSKKGDREEAEVLFDKLLAGRYEDIKIYVALADIYGRQSKPKKIIECYEKALTVKPDATNIWYNLAAIQSLTQDFDGCLKSLKKAIRLGGEAVKEAVWRDRRFNSIRNEEKFGELIKKGTKAQRHKGAE